MRRFFSLIIALSSFIHFVNAQQNIAIHGSSENAAGRKVELYRSSDQISKAEVLIDSFRVGEDGRFELRCYTNYPMMVTMQVENYSQSFYVEAAREYSVFIPSFDWNLDEKRNVFLDPEPLPLIFQNIPPDDINLMIDSIDKVINDFISENYFYFDQRFKPSVYYFDSLQYIVNKLYPNTQSDFINRYKTYQLAEIKYAMKFDTRKNLINKFIRNNPILYQDENYMSLFATLYAYSISKGTKDISVYRLSHWVNNLDLKTYIDSLGTDPLLRHEQVRELAALQALYESYYNFKYYDPEMVVKMIEKLSQQTKFPEHRQIARHILEAINGAEAATENNIFALPNVDKKMENLSDLQGKWVYLSFVRVNEPASISEIETIAHFKEKYLNQRDDVELVTIACDREFQKMFHFLKNTRRGKQFDWTWLHFNGNYDLLRHFKVTTFPWFVLINPDGQIEYDITPAPSTGFLANGPWNKKQ